MLRTEIDRALGYETDQTDPLRPGYRLKREQEAHIDDRTLMGGWDPIPEDPALIPLIHEASDGVIPHELAESLADRIEEAIPHKRDCEPLYPEVRYQEMARTFVSGLRFCVKSECPMEFA